MKEIKVNFKKLDQAAVMPKYAHPTDAGMDLVAVSKTSDEFGNVVYGFGIAVEIPEGYVGLLFPRSSNCKHLLSLTNSVGVIDSGYRGEIKAVFGHNITWFEYPTFIQRLKVLLFGNAAGGNANVRGIDDYHYEVGDKVAQLIILPYPKVKFCEVDNLSSSDRGEGGYGSTGK